MYSEKNKNSTKNLTQNPKTEGIHHYQACTERNIKGSSVSGRMTLNKTMEMSE